MLTRTRGRKHITTVLKSLHWLPVHFRIDFKVLLLVFKCVNILGSYSLSDLLLPYQPSWIQGFSGIGLLATPLVSSKTNREVALGRYSPRLWNSLPKNLRADCWCFQKKLKTHLLTDFTCLAFIHLNLLWSFDFSITTFYICALVFLFYALSF